jgi:hypothetical protein
MPYVSSCIPVPSRHMIVPAPGYVFIIEDENDGLTKTAKELGIVSAEKRLAGTTGVLYSINDVKKCPQCGFGEECGFKVGDRVIYSKFVSEQIDLIADDIPRGRLRALPVESLLGKIC